MGALEKFDNVIRKLSGMDQELEELGEAIMSSTEVDHMMVDMNILQMDKGKDAFDKQIEPAYTSRTVEIKKKKGQQADYVTLEDTRAFKGAMKVRNFKSKAEILSEDEKSAGLQAKYGEQIFGLNDNHLAMLRNFLKPKFQLHLRRYINQ